MNIFLNISKSFFIILVSFHCFFLLSHISIQLILIFHIMSIIWVPFSAHHDMLIWHHFLAAKVTKFLVAKIARQVIHFSSEGKYIAFLLHCELTVWKQIIWNLKGFVCYELPFFPLCCFSYKYLNASFLVFFLTNALYLFVKKIYHVQKLQKVQKNLKVQKVAKVQKV